MYREPHETLARLPFTWLVSSASSGMDDVYITYWAAKSLSDFGTIVTRVFFRTGIKLTAFGYFGDTA